MRILIATLSPDLIGGVEKYLQSVVPALLGRGHSIGLLYEYPSDGKGEGIDSGLDVRSWCARELGVESTLRSIGAFAPDVVYSQGLESEALEQGLLDGYFTAFYAHTYWGTCITGTKTHSLPRFEPCTRRLGIACLAHYYPRRCGGLNPATMWQLYQIQSRRKERLPEYKAVLTASRHMLREYERHGVSPERLHLVPLPVGDSSRQAAEAPSRTPGNRILFLGRLMDVKGLDYLLQAIPRAESKLGKPLHLTVAGDGPDRAHLERMARRVGVMAEFTGWIGSERRSDLMRSSDLLAVPSLWPEPFGMVGVEAGRFGMPAVGFAVGGIPDWLISGETGELAPGDPPTVEGLADAIVRALADPEHYRKLCAGAWRKASEFNLDRHISQLELILSPQLSAAQITPSMA
jgi:glycosyltransferase involved in cell wall biosynthesis